MTEEEQRARLIQRLDKIYSQVQQLLVNDHIFWEFQRVVSENAHFLRASGLFTRWVADGYVHSAVIGLRRQIKAQAGSISLKGFLREIQECPQLISREHYMSLYKGARVPLRMAATRA
jgi:hypothetical protein